MLNFRGASKCGSSLIPSSRSAICPGLWNRRSALHSIEAGLEITKWRSRRNRFNSSGSCRQRNVEHFIRIELLRAWKPLRPFFEKSAESSTRLRIGSRVLTKPRRSLDRQGALEQDALIARRYFGIENRDCCNIGRWTAGTWPGCAWRGRNTGNQEWFGTPLVLLGRTLGARKFPVRKRF